MIQTKHLFISHSWTYHNEYNRLVALLKADPYFSFRNFSVDKYNPIHNAPNQQLLAEAIKVQIAQSSCVLVLAGVYASYSKWIDKEIAIAKHGFMYPKPIIAIEPWGSERTSAFVKNNADAVVKWQTSSIIQAIHQLT